MIHVIGDGVADSEDTGASQGQQRAAMAARWPAPPPRPDDPRPRDVYIVGSEADAALLREGLSIADTIRAESGLDPLRAEVVVATTDSEAAAMAEALDNGNRILAELGQVDRVIILKQRATDYVAYTDAD